jgi:hopanoid biosynthesis associated protein HpnK
MKRLIVNADDFGFTRGVNAGIVRAFKSGIVTSTTIMANGEAFEDAASLARANPELGVGCHLAVVGGRPVAAPSEVPSLVDRDGALPATLTRLVIRIARGRALPEEIEREFRAQVQRVVRSGIQVTHLDSHKHSATHPRVMGALARVAAEFGIKCVRNPFESVFAGRRDSHPRWAYVKQFALSAAIAPAAIEFTRIARDYGLKTPDRFFGVKLTGLLDTSAIRRIMESLGEGTAELMCHPGISDEDLAQARTRLRRQREQELEAVSDAGLRERAGELGIKLISYREL